MEKTTEKTTTEKTTTEKTSKKTTEKKKTKKKTTFWGLFSCCRRKHRVCPVSDDSTQELFTSSNESEDETQQPASSIQAEKEALKDKMVLGDKKANDTKESPTTHRDVAQVSYPQSVRVQQDSWFGFPNPGQICYMNSSLQSLLTLREFIMDVSSQEEVWSLSPGTEIISCLKNIVRCHGSKNAGYKLWALAMFKRVLSVQAPEFGDCHQKDAHEFLTAVVDQIRSLASSLQEFAAFTERSYTCPVKRNLVFTMQNTRKCKSCGAQSIREEDFTNLSLDLVPGSSVQQMLQEYQMETLLEYRCECGGNTSGQRSTFLTLPKFLMLHLKRFTFTQDLLMRKLHYPVDLCRGLLVTSTQAEGWYSLVSAISHLGSGGNAGHYISDGLHPDHTLEDHSDRWLLYNDAQVLETTGAFVCETRQKTAYVLFYQKRM
ncbi:ubiquitin carboxyl-terminal hydrolase 29-like [Mugil cephalus]|uniref:ubiquitin carboxyl-terminal hydrolase 29-like n=1 Tax=Mugil cephalus TaxID=48193 RepID=UPI001FB744DF|nr:ubiquitin carboxyl-terminal hydrolase 29-like [Mugil cephalus]